MTAQYDLDQVRPHLEPGERVLWIGRPDPRRAAWYEMRRAGGLLALFGVPAFASIIGVLVLLGYAHFLMRLWLFWGAIACNAGLLIAALPLLWVLLRWNAKQFLYVVTSHAFLYIRPFLAPLPGKEYLVRRFSLQEAYDLEVMPHGDGFGTLVFLGVWLPTLPRRFPFHPAFRGIPNVEHVLAIAREAAQQAGFVEQPRPRFSRLVSQTLKKDAWLYVAASILATVFSIAMALELGGADLSRDLWPTIRRCPEGLLLVAGALMCLALSGLICSFRVREILRRYPRLRRWQVVLVAIQAGLLLVWLGMVFWVGLATVAAGARDIIPVRSAEEALASRWWCNDRIDYW